MTSITGATSQTCTSLPFGDGLSCTGTEWGFNHFTDDFHDGEDTLEHTWFRQLSTTQGRWMGTDPYLGSIDLTNPQSMNRYAYVIASPVSLTDPYGLDCTGSQTVVVTPSGATFGSLIISSCTPSGGAGGDPGAGIPLIYRPGIGTGGNGGGQQDDSKKPQKSFADCVREGGDYFSLQNGLVSLTGGRLGTGPVASAFLGNSISGVIGLFQGNFGGARDAVIEKGVPIAVNTAAGLVPNVSISSTTASATLIETPTSATVAVTIENTTTNLPFGDLARAGAQGLTDALESFGNLVKAPIDLTASSFSAIVCSIGR